MWFTLQNTAYTGDLIFLYTPYFTLYENRRNGLLHTFWNQTFLLDVFYFLCGNKGQSINYNFNWCYSSCEEDCKTDRN